MRSLIHSVAILVFSFSLSIAEAQNKVVVVPMGGKSPGGVARTGQTQCYNSAGLKIFCPGTGQDGELQTGVAVTPRFTDNGNGTVSDRLTGLIWLREGNCTVFFSGDATGQNKRPWQAALDAANQFASGYCGLTDGSSAGDWRLPNLRELQSLVDYSQSDPSLPAGHPFLHTVSSYYWSSTTYAGNTDRAWLVYFYYGDDGNDSKSGSYFVRAVRGGQ